MEQPWPQPQQPAPDADDLPLAGLLAELLAASEADSAPPPEGDPFAALAQPQGWPQGEPESSLDAAEVLRALDDASQPVNAPATDNLSGALLARLMAEGEPDASSESAAPVAGETSPAVPARPAQCSPTPPVVSEPAVPETDAAADQPAALLARLLEEDEPAAVADTAAIVPDEPEMPAISEPAVPETDAAADQPAALLARLLEEDEPAAVADTAAIVPDEPEMPAVSDAAEAEAGPAAAILPDAPPATAESGLAGEADVPAAQPGAWQEQASAGPDEERAATASPEPAESQASSGADPDSTMAPAGRSPAIPACDEDEFELVDAAQAERMLDRLLDAARSAIRSTQEPAPGAAPQVSVRAPVVSEPRQAAGGFPPVVEPGPALAGGRPPAVPASIEGRQTSLPAARAAAEEPWMREPAPRRNAEDRSAEASPIPPAAALMALGLPERLRARLESLGDIEEILKSHTVKEPAQERKPRLLVFRAGGESYALSMECVREVERVSRVTPVPGAPAFVQGLVNLRGEILPLLDLAALFGRKGEAPGPRLIVAQASSADPVVALMVEELNGLAPFQETEVQPQPQPGPVRGSLEHRDRRVWWIDPVAVFGAEALEKAAGVGQWGGLEERE